MAQILLRKVRNEQRITTADLACSVGANRADIIAIEKGELIPYKLRLLRIARKLNYKGNPYNLLKEVNPDKHK